METMKKWRKADNYGGEDMSEYYICYSRTRDSGPLERSNFECISKEFDIDEDTYENAAGTVINCHFRHWACGWIDAIMIHESDEEAVLKGNDIKSKLEQYAVYDDSHFCDLQTDEAVAYWAGMSYRERIRYCVDCEVSIFAARRDIPELDVLESLEEC